MRQETFGTSAHEAVAGTLTCRVCSNRDGNTQFTAREMMFGTREEFTYFECASCGCVQITEIPEDMGRFYPAGYYSLSGTIVRTPGWVSRLLKRQLTSYYAGRPNALGWILALRYRNELPWIRARFVHFDHRILDVGCGDGRTLNLLHTCGFQSLTGIDPFIAEDIHYPNGVRIFRGELGALREEFDVVLFHQSIEHTPDPLKALREAHRVLHPQGTIIVSTPVTSSLAWRRYGADWVQLDPPRHLLVQSAKSMALLADKANLRVEQILYDSTEFQFVGSEAYRRGIPLVDYYAGKKIFSPQEVRKFTKEATRLNAGGEGDSACFYLRPRQA